MLSAAEEYEVISRDSSLSEEEKSSRAAALTVEGATFEELALTMTHVAAHADPSVSVQPLCDSGEHIEVTVAARVSLQSAHATCGKSSGEIILESVPRSSNFTIVSRCLHRCLLL